MGKLNRTSLAALALVAVWGCSPDDYPTEARFDPPTHEIVLPDGELFFYVPPAGVTVSAVGVPGEFNGWDPSANPMQLLSDGRWVAGIDLEPGTYQYKYHFNGTDWAGNMCNDANWGDPASGNQVDADLDECNGENAVRTIASLGHTFRYIVPEGVAVDQVNLAGNLITPNWTPDATPMAQIWMLTVDVEPGEYMYKYVFNGDQWSTNMCNDPTWGDEANGFDVDPDIEECNPADNNNGVLVVEEAGTHTFRYIVPANVDPSTIESVSVAGNFIEPNWTPSAGPMQETYSVTVDLSDLEPGEYLYKYVFNGGDWGDNMCDSETWGHPDFGNKIDPDVETCVDDGFGGANGQLVVD